METELARQARREVQLRKKKIFWSLANMPLVTGSVQLNQKAVRVPKLERFLGPAGLHLQITRFQFRQNRVRVKSRDSEIDVIELSRRALLLDAEEALSDAQDVRLFGVLLERHPEELLLKLRSLVN